MTAASPRFVSRLAEPLQRRLRLQSEVSGQSMAAILAKTLDQGLLPLDELARRMSDKASALLEETGQQPAA